MFENVEISLDELPSVGDLEWQPLDARFRARMLVERLLTSAFVLTAGIVVSVVPPVPFYPSLAVVLGAVFAAAALVISPFVAIPRMGFVVRDKDLVYRSGVIWRKVTAIPFNRIQHVETSSSPLDRRFNLASLKVFTAGGAGGDLKIDGLGKEKAEQLRALVLEKAGASIESD
jgi:membrane protein YdbS with pleckstrin-like domain